MAIREKVLKAIQDAIDEEQASVKAHRKSGSLDPDFNGSAIVEAAEQAFDDGDQPEEKGVVGQHWEGSPKRPETGPMCFGKDWPGLFVRGDDAFHYARHLEMLLECVQESSDDRTRVSALMLKGLLSDLNETVVREGKNPEGCQVLKDFSQCLP